MAVHDSAVHPTMHEVLSDFSTRSYFSDNSMICLAPYPSQFEVTYANGESARHVSYLAPSRHHAALAAALDFRNRHCEPVYTCGELCERLGRSCGSQAATQVPVAFTRWPLSIESDADVLVSPADGSVRVASLDGLATLVLLPHRQAFRVGFPSLVSWAADASERAPHYAWLEQVHSTAFFPSRWRHALALALAHATHCPLADALAELDAANEHPSVHMPASEYCFSTSESVVMVLPPALAAAHMPVGPSLFSPDLAGRGVLVRRTPRLTLYWLGRTRRVVALAADDGVSMETQTTAAGELYVRQRTALGEETLVHSDGIGAAGAQAGLAAVTQFYGECLQAALVPPRCPNVAAESQLRLRSTGSTGSGSISGSSTAFAGAPCAVLSAAVLVEVELDGVARFAAFCDGRTRAAFVDRTICSTDAHGRECALLTAAGDELTIRMARPLSHAPYVAWLAAFRAWALASADERAAQAERTRLDDALARHVHEQLLRTRSFLTMADWLPQRVFFGGLDPKAQACAMTRDAPAAGEGFVSAALAGTENSIERAQRMLAVLDALGNEKS